MINNIIIKLLNHLFLIMLLLLVLLKIYHVHQKDHGVLNMELIVELDGDPNPALNKIK